MRGLRGWIPADERGAVAVLTAGFAIVIVGMAALVVDVGALHDERRQLQNGADAAALAVAHSCALGACDTTLAPGLADGNAHDDAANVSSVDVSVATRRVTVATTTRATDGGTILPYSFAQVITGSRGQTVRASATATWSGISRADTIPLVISSCEWDRATNGGTTYNTTFTGPVTVILFHTGGQAADDCAAQAGQDTDGDSRLPGGFGWVESSGCKATFIAGTLTVGVDTGNSSPGDCNLSTLVGTTVLVPIFDDLTAGGSTGRYHIKGFAELRITGYRFPGNTGGSTPCTPPRSCVGGYFTRFVSPADAGGGPDLGARTVQLVS